MKRMILLSLLLGCIPGHIVAQKAWTKVPQEQAEYNRLMQACNQIAERFIAMGGGALQSSGFANAIFQYLKEIGTPTSLRVLEEQVKMGRVPESYLKNV